MQECEEIERPEIELSPEKKSSRVPAVVGTSILVAAGVFFAADVTSNYGKYSAYYKTFYNSTYTVNNSTYPCPGPAPFGADCYVVNKGSSIALASNVHSTTHHAAASFHLGVVHIGSGISHSLGSVSSALHGAANSITHVAVANPVATGTVIFDVALLSVTLAPMVMAIKENAPSLKELGSSVRGRLSSAAHSAFRRS